MITLTDCGTEEAVTAGLMGSLHATESEAGPGRTSEARARVFVAVPVVPAMAGCETRVGPPSGVKCSSQVRPGRLLLMTVIGPPATTGELTLETVTAKVEGLTIATLIGDETAVAEGLAGSEQVTETVPLPGWTPAGRAMLLTTAPEADAIALDEAIWAPAEGVSTATQA